MPKVQFEENHPKHIHSQSHESLDSSSLFVSFQAKLLFKCVVLYSIADFYFAFFNPNPYYRDVSFFTIIAYSIISDLSSGPAHVDIRILEETLKVATYLLLTLAIFLGASACITQFFFDPREIDVDDDSSWSKNTLWTWDLDYDPFRNATNGQGSKEEPEVIRGLVHFVVCATRLTLARFLLVEAELLLKKLIQMSYS